MAAPTTPLLSSFTGANEDPLSEGGRWLGPTQVGSNQMRRASNVAIAQAAAPAASNSYWSTPFTGQMHEVWCNSIPTLPGAGKGVNIIARILNPGSSSPLASFYNLVWINGTGYQLYQNFQDSFTQLGSTVATHTHAAGEGLWLTVSGTGATITLTGYYRTTGGVWTQIITATDSTANRITATTAYIGIGPDDTVGTYDDFGGGSDAPLQPRIFLPRPASRFLARR